jgi:hypothetical protein
MAPQDRVRLGGTPTLSSHIRLALDLRGSTLVTYEITTEHLQGVSYMPSQKLMMTALDAALSAQINLLFSNMASAASGPNSEARFAEGIKNAAAFYDKAAKIVKEVMPGAADTAIAEKRGRRPRTRVS